MPTAVACFDLLDAHVVAGHADDPALVAGGRTWSVARLLEEVSAFGGVLGHCGVVTGDRVVVALPDSVEAVVAVLAAGRLGGVPVLGEATDGEKVLVTASSEVAALKAARVDVVLVKHLPGAPWQDREGLDHDWDRVLRAGRTDPAPCAQGATLATDDPRVGAWTDALLARRPLELPG